MATLNSVHLLRYLLYITKVHRQRAKNLTVNYVLFTIRMIVLFFLCSHLTLLLFCVSKPSSFLYDTCRCDQYYVGLIRVYDHVSAFVKNHFIFCTILMFVSFLVILVSILYYWRFTCLVMTIQTILIPWHASSCYQ